MNLQITQGIQVSVDVSRFVFVVFDEILYLNALSEPFRTESVKRVGRTRTARGVTGSVQTLLFLNRISLILRQPRFERIWISYSQGGKCAESAATFH